MRNRSMVRIEDGNAAILALVALTLLAGLSMAQFTLTRTNVRKSNYYLSRAELRRYAESGIAMAFHNLTYSVNGGQVGTLDWLPDTDDVGADGIGGTSDFGENDGIPTPGEPNVVPVPVGTGAIGARLIAHVSDTAYPRVKRIIATSFTTDEIVTLEKQVKEKRITIPRTGPAYVDPALALNLQGNNFTINGNDTNPDGTPGPGPAQYGLSTAEAATPGDNQAALLAQIGLAQQDNITGLGADPSVGEVPAFDIDALAAEFLAIPNQTQPPGTHSGITWGYWNDETDNDMVTTYVGGDLQLSGAGSGAGVLVVDGDLTIVGSFTFMGLVIVTGDVRLTGGGAGVHVWGTLMAKASIDAVDPEVEVSGTADLIYSSVVLDKLEQTASENGAAGYETVYYGERTY